MPYPELPDEHQEPQEPTGPIGAAAAYLSRLFRGRGQIARLPADASSIIPSSPERTDLDIHKERVAAKVAALFNMVDARVGGWIGYDGNIREELRRRLVPTGSHQRRLNTEGLDPALGAYVQHDIFLFRLDDGEGGLEAMYKVDCQIGRFIPSIHLATHDGFVAATLFMGPNQDQFHHVQMRRVFEDGRVKHLTTFTPNFRNPYDPPHPLTIAQGVAPVPYSHMIYDDIGHDGNVTLLDGQIVRDPSGSVAGKYAAADYTISGDYYRSLPIHPSRRPTVYR